MNNMEKVYHYILEYKRANDGNSPTLREMADQLHINSTSQIRYYLFALQGQGKIRIPGNKSSRSIIVTGGQWNMQ